MPATTASLDSLFTLVDDVLLDEPFAELSDAWLTGNHVIEIHDERYQVTYVLFSQTPLNEEEAAELMEAVNECEVEGEVVWNDTAVQLTAPDTDVTAVFTVKIKH